MELPSKASFPATLVEPEHPESAVASPALSEKPRQSLMEYSQDRQPTFGFESEHGEEKPENKQAQAIVASEMATGPAAQEDQEPLQENTKPDTKEKHGSLQENPKPDTKEEQEQENTKPEGGAWNRGEPQARHKGGAGVKAVANPPGGGPRHNRVPGAFRS